MGKVISITRQKARLIYNSLQKQGGLLRPGHWEANAHLDLFWNVVAKRTNTKVSVVTRLCWE